MITAHSGFRGDARGQVASASNVDSKNRDPWPTAVKSQERSTRFGEKRGVKSRNTLRVDGVPTDQTKNSAEQISSSPPRRLTQLR